MFDDSIINGVRHIVAREAYAVMANLREEILPYVVLWNDVDSLGHMTASRYAALYDDVRWQWVRRVLSQIAVDALVPVVIESRIRYHQELNLGARILVQARLDRFVGKSFRFQQAIRLEDGPVASTAEYVTLLLDTTTRRPLPIPPAVLEAFPDVPREPWSSGHGRSAGEQRLSDGN